MQEPLVTCPTCNTHGFTERGLKAHRCKGVNRSPAAPGSATSDPKSAIIVAPGNISKSPKLQQGNDTEVAAELGRLVRDAQDGTRRILLCGLFIETIVANLKRGELGPWIQAHEQEIGCGWRAIYGWRDFSREVLKQVGGENCNALQFSIPAHEFLALPAAEVPEDCREARAKIDELIEGKSVKQLMFQFREGEVVEDKLVRTGRGGDRTANRGPRRTNLEIDREDFETKSRVLLPFLVRYLNDALTIQGPHPKPNDPIPRPWDLLDDKHLRELKELAIDLRDGILESERRRATARPRK
jgi:hypothetical protein